MQEEEREKNGTMESVDPDTMYSEGGYFNHKEDGFENDTMDAVDPDEYKKFLNGRDDNLDEELKPIEVKSTEHLELQRREEAKKEAQKNAHTAAKEVFDWLESVLTAVVMIV